MKTTFLRLGAIAATLSLLAVSSVAYAATPTLSVYSSGGGDMVQLTVNGDPNSSVVLYTQRVSNGMQSQYLGTTNGSGYFSTTVSTSAYGITANSYAYVTVNNQTSSSVLWPTYGTYTGGSVYLSQNSVNVGVGQSTYVTISGGQMPYSLYPSTPNLFQTVLSGNNLQISGLTYGSGTLNICSAGGGSCASLSVSVGGGYYYPTPTPTTYPYGQISLSQTSVSLNSGNSTNISIYGNGSYYISSNTNSNIASAYVSGSTLTINALSYGSTNISVCQSYYSSQCATVYVTVNYSGGQNLNPISFSQQTLNLNVGQSTNVSVYGGQTPSYYIGYNSNSSGASAYMSGSTLTVNGIAPSNNVIVVCSGANNCAALTVRVGQSGYNGYNQNWTYCANEGQYCNFNGTAQVRYGSNGQYTYRTVAGGTLCNNSVFGDPAFGVVKQCYYSSAFAY